MHPNWCSTWVWHTPQSLPWSTWPHWGLLHYGSRWLKLPVWHCQHGRSDWEGPQPGGSPPALHLWLGSQEELTQRKRENTLGKAQSSCCIFKGKLCGMSHWIHITAWTGVVDISCIQLLFDFFFFICNSSLDLFNQWRVILKYFMEIEHLLYLNYIWFS